MASHPPDIDRSLIADVMRQVDDAEKASRSGPEKIGDFQVVEVLGRGGMGIVYRARQVRPDREVALKVLRATMVSGAMLRRFEREAQVLGRLHHIGIAQIYEAGMDDFGYGPQPFFAMELVDGLPLTDYCDEQKLDLHDRLMLIAKVCDAVDHAHQKKIVHRDLKPSNILVARDGQPKILDFGVARVTEANAGAGTMVTEARKMVGTLPFMSPEQVADQPAAIDARSDVYALGVLSYRILTGRHPFSVNRRSIPQAIAAIQNEEPTRLSLLDRDLRGDVETIILKSLEKEPERRYQSAADLASDIRRFLNHEPIQARPASAGYRIRKFARRNRSFAYSLGAVFTIMLVALVLTTRSSRLAQERLADFRRLADVRELARMKAEADRLYPAIPANILPMEHWLDRAETFRARLQLYRAQLDELHERASEKNLYKQNNLEVSRQSEERFEIKMRIRELENELQSIESNKSLSPQDVTRREEIEEELWHLNDQSTWLFYQIPRDHICRFDDPADLVEHEVLVELVNELSEFFEPVIGDTSSVRRRLRFAKTVYERSIKDHQAEWKNAIASIADTSQHPMYRGLRIREQIGLVPLGADPQSGLWEFAFLQTGDIPKRDNDGRLMMTERSALVFILMPGKPALMTCPPVNSLPEVYPPRSDYLTATEFQFLNDLPLAPYFLSKYEMTQGQWQEYRLNNPSRFYPEHAGTTDVTLLHPVENISWTEAFEVLWQLGCVLPSEAQWQAACARHLPSDRGQRSRAASHQNIHQSVDRCEINSFGIVGMTGNVAEWCDDAFAKFDHPVDPITGRRLTGWGERGYRVIRGGDFLEPSILAPTLLRRSADLNYRHPTVGLRPARLLD